MNCEVDIFFKPSGTSKITKGEMHPDSRRNT